MNWEQWLFEALAIRKKEDAAAKTHYDTIKTVLETLQHMAINLLGLNAFSNASEAEGKTSDLPKIIPLAMMVGHPEVLNALMEQSQKDVSEKKAGENEAFEDFSAQLHQQLKTGASDLPGDMIPILTEEDFQLDHNAYWNSVDVQEMLQNMGVKQRASAKPVVHIKAASKDKDPFADFDPEELARFEAEMKEHS